MTQVTSAPPSFYTPAPVRLLHSSMTVGRYYATHFLGALFPVAAGIMLYGWRGGMALATVMASAGAAYAVWSHIGLRGRQLHPAHCLWLALLLGLMLPAHLFGGVPVRGISAVHWPLLVAGGVGLVIVLWLLGGLGGGFVHPVAVTYLLLFLGFRAYLVPTYVLAPNHLANGDVLNAPDEINAVSTDPWLRRTALGHYNALRGEPASQWLTDYTTGRLRPERGQMPLHELIRDRMPPLEDLIVGGHPSAVGVGSAIAVIIGGLFLLYRGLIDFRIPLLVPLCAFAALLVLPAPTVIRDDGAHFRWFALRQPDVRWDTAVTFVNYEVMAGPLLFTAFFLATSPALRPLSRRARVMYACLLGFLCAAAQLYVSVWIGPYLALLLAGLAGPVFDRWFAARPLI